MVTTFEEWKAACEKEHSKLTEVTHFLNENGKERMLVFGLMINLAGYCSSAEELLEWIETKEGLEKEDLLLLDSHHARAPISSLRKVADLEKTANVPDGDPNGKKPVFYVTYRIDARYVAEVHADNVEDAKREAQDSWESADFGEAEDIGGEPIIIEDEDGNYVWEH